MYREFDYNKEMFTKEYRFWDNLWTKLIIESNFGRRDLSDEYIYSKYEIIFTSFVSPPGGGLVKLRSVECPDKIETFFKLKYKEFL